MFSNNYSAYQYTNKGKVLYYLRQIIRQELHHKERDLIYSYCGIGVDTPMGWCELAARLKLLSPEIAEKCYYGAIEKIRKAIPGSKLDKLVAGFNPIEIQ